MTGQRCKTCRHFEPDPGEESYALQNGRCNHPDFLDRIDTFSNGGKDCRVWQAKDNKETDK